MQCLQESSAHDRKLAVSKMGGAHFVESARYRLQGVATRVVLEKYLTFQVDMFPNNHQPLTMRPILKSQQSSTSMNSVSSCDNGVSVDTLALNCHMLEKQTMIQLNYLQYGRMVPNSLPLSPYLDSISRNVNRMPVSPQPRSMYNLPCVMKINENAVRLDDIDKKWHANEEDSLLFPYRQKGEYKVDYADIDLPTIHQEAQKYNDCNGHENLNNSDCHGEYKWDHFLKLYEPIILNEVGSSFGKLDYDYLMVNPIAVYCLRHYFENLPVRRMPYTKMFERNGGNV
ncbi:hypothetical protein ILUMI_23760 [Ignelater luminosus]|uniref:Uncharacterized protein n=1 Tax=Ignelater luminosus TaxID=2038154 RepID=A0A8K0FWT0_IGNLU|nr:hypothetical protein ILUMI_23760 [Ignelater luminosus]